jgi:hypothetical protein
METRKCGTCKEIKSTCEFYWKVDKKNNYESWGSKCKSCYTNYNKSNEVRKRRRERNKERRKTDPTFKINESCKARIHEILNGYKNCTSSKLIGCTREQIIKWMEFQLEPGMTLENHGSEWHIDHVVPISFFDNTKHEQQILCFNWSNLRPLNSSKNISKFNKIDKDYILSHYNTLNTFSKSNQEYQIDTERCLWQRIELWYGKNLQDEEVSFEEILKWAIRNQAPKSDTDKDMEKAQRLDDNGLDVSSQHI